ncbi:Lipase 3 [Eumeta japonica]|uniref:Lipase 3 n=1 Tax=Eumeta variegata TaxID=151549 RepID=A0A4C1VZA0_EUMVA|nr:Lipase 3 [Eumeta japonica]
MFKTALITVCLLAPCFAMLSPHAQSVLRDSLANPGRYTASQLEDGLLSVNNGDIVERVDADGVIVSNEALEPTRNTEVPVPDPFGAKNKAVLFAVLHMGVMLKQRDHKARSREALRLQYRYWPDIKINGIGEIFGTMISLSEAASRLTTDIESKPVLIGPRLCDLLTRSGWSVPDTSVSLIASLPTDSGRRRCRWCMLRLCRVHMQVSTCACVAVFLAGSNKATSALASSNAYPNLFQPEIVKKYGYPSEIHSVQTDDGYILEMHRIPHGREGAPLGGRPAVLLMHGLLSSSADYVIIGPGKALGYILADAGFDVWLGNARGNHYSRRHTSRNPDSIFTSFWDFSWEEIGRFDVAAMVDYVLETTSQKNLHYVGHSQGTTAFFVLNSMRPEYNEKFASAHLLAPVAFMNNFPSDALASVASHTNILYVSNVFAICELTRDNEELVKSTVSTSLL